MGALDMGLMEDELAPLVASWREANPNIVKFWWDVDRAAKEAIQHRTEAETHGIHFIYKSAMLFIELPSGRRLCYVKPRMGENQFGGESITYEGTGSTKKWERIESYGPKFVENIVQATLSIKDNNFTAGIKKAITGTKELKTHTANATGSLKKMGSQSKSTGFSLASLAKKVTGVVAAYAGFRQIIQFGKECITACDTQVTDI